MKQLHKRRVTILAMMLADWLAFALAGGIALAAAILMHRAQVPSLADVFEFDTRNRLIDFFYGGIVWVLWFHLVKNRYRKRIPFWSEQSESIKGVLILSLVNLALIAFTRNDYSRTLWLTGWLLLVITIPLIRTLVRYLLSRLKLWQMPSWIIGGGVNAVEARLALESEWQMGFDICGSFQLTCDPNKDESVEFKNWLKNSVGEGVRDTTFIVALEDGQSGVIQNIVQELSLNGARGIYFIPDIRGIPLYGADINYFFSHEVLLLRLKNNLESKASKLIKRGFDILVASTLAIPAALLVFCVGLVIVLEDGLPIFYRQQRQGMGGKPFRMLKVRSMRKDADLTLQLWQKNMTPEWLEYQANNKLKNDPRLLRTGKWIRQFSIDELPQLINVIKGEMSLVGPRPILASEAEQYGENIVLYNSTRPALTGLWQVSGRSDASFDQRTNLDAWYIRNWSIGFDIVILIRTFAVVLFRKGAY